jgi:uncharacterized protein
VPPVFPDELTAPWLRELRAELPGVALFDAHTHIGQADPDGFTCTPGELRATLRAADARAVVFPMQEPSGYADANDRVIEEAQRSSGRLTAFCRIDPRSDPLAEAERCLAAGAVGIKLHPRAERFSLDTRELDGLLALAHERRLPVLVHAGRGIPALGRHALDICQRYPRLRLILAHAGISDLAWIWRATVDHPNLFFDTAWWSPSDLLALFALVAPRHILFASDAPYAAPSFSALMSLRYALQVGLSHDQLRLVFGGQLARIVAGRDAADAGEPPGPGRLGCDPLLDRVHTFLVASIGQMLQGLDAAETLAVAALACEVGESTPQATTCATVLRLLELQERHVASGAQEGRPARFAPGLPLIVMAAGVVRTPEVPMPPVGAPSVDVDERAA